MKLPASFTLLCIFALFHGHAHGVEIPPFVDDLLIGVSMLVASALLLIGGFTLGSLRWQAAVRYIAAARLLMITYLLSRSVPCRLGTGCVRIGDAPGDYLP